MIKIVEVIEKLPNHPFYPFLKKYVVMKCSNCKATNEILLEDIKCFWDIECNACKQLLNINKIRRK